MRTLLPPAPTCLALCLPLCLAASLAACTRQGEGTTVTFNAGEGNTLASADGEGGSAGGEVKLDVPGFSGKFTLPRLKVSADDFDLNGVHLYPGSTIRSLNIDAGKGGGHEGGQGGVRLTFTSPAAPATVRDWLMERLNKAGFTVSAVGDGLAGETDEHKPFALQLVPASGGRGADGSMAIGG